MRALLPMLHRSPPAARLNARVLVAGLLLAMPLFAILLLNLRRDPRALASPLVGRPAPALSLPPLDGGTPLSLDALRGRPAVLSFWASWCAPCVQEHAVLAHGARDFPEVRFSGVVYADDEEAARAFLERRPAGFPSYLDPGGKAAIAYGVSGVPETFFLDGSGRIAAKYVGPLDERALAALIAQAKAGAR